MNERRATMGDTVYYPSWQDQLAYRTGAVNSQTIVEDGGFKSLLARLDAGAKIPVHPEGLAVYCFLEGSGWIIVDGERFAVAPGSIVITPAGASRGVEAETRLAFLATRLAQR
jgi:mannose-6-phosphate isomerase-like protein (cupin superfamily)